MPFDWGQCQIPHPSPGPKGWGFQLTGALVAEKCKKSSLQSVYIYILGESLATKISFTATFLEEKRFHHYVGIT